MLDITASHATFPQLADTPDSIVGDLNQRLSGLIDEQQSELAAIQPLAETAVDAFKAKMAALREATRQAAAQAINKAYDGLENAARQHPEEKPAIQQALQGVQQAVQSFTNDAGNAFDAVDHAGSFVIDGVSEGATRVADAFSTVGDGIGGVATTVADGIKSIFHF